MKLTKCVGARPNDFRLQCFCLFVVYFCFCLQLPSVLFLFLSLYRCHCLCLFPSLCLSLFLSVCLSVCPSVCLSICLSLFISLFSPLTFFLIYSYVCVQDHAHMSARACVQSTHIQRHSQSKTITRATAVFIQGAPTTVESEGRAI